MNRITRITRVVFSLFALFALSVLPAAARRQNAPGYVWLEGESAVVTGAKPTIGGWGRKQFLSGEKWLQISVDADKVEKQVPADGILLRYDFRAAKSGKYEVWNRIGYEFVRSPFAWRLDGGAWNTVAPDTLTTDLMELETWNEVAWLKMGEQALTPGAHRLEIRLTKTTDDKGKTARVLYASDALCLTTAPFSPNGKNKPDEDGRDARDREAAEKRFVLPAPPSAAARVSLPLNGLWEVCRHDEQRPGETASPLTDRPKMPHWKAIPVPSDRNETRPDLIFAHRLWYRTHVVVPESCAGRAFTLVFPQNNLNTTVFVNGTYCGFNKNPYCRFQIDVTKGIKPGVNEVWVGIRDAWYGYSTNPNDPMKLRRKFNIPLSFTKQGFQDLAYPIWNGFQSGILATPEIVAAGSVYAKDVFCKPSVARREMAADVSLTNRTAKSVSGQVACDVLDDKTGMVAHRLPPQPFTLVPDRETTVSVSSKWENPTLWWPDTPHLYRIRTTVIVEGRAVDISETRFGFREWTSEGKDFKLNGIVWHGWADLIGSRPTKEAWLASYRKTNQRFMRLSGVAQGGTHWMGMAPDDALTFFDENGVVVRRCGPLDGEAIGYNAIENDPDLKKESPIKMDLMRNWRDQMVAQVKGERNHPSIMVWSTENEWLYINCINLYGGLMDLFEAESYKTAEAVRAVDPTRLVMTDGGGAGKANGMPVHGDHYVFSNSSQYPALAYEANPTGGGRGRWVWDQQRPRFLGEDYFATGINPADYAHIGGEEAFQGKVQTRRAMGIVYRMLNEGYRWGGLYGAWHFWIGDESEPGYDRANAPRAVLCRQWDGTFGSGQSVTRTLGIFNDTQYPDPLTLTWSLTVGGKKTVEETHEYRVAPGTNQKFDITLPLPTVTTRQEGEFTLSLLVKGQEVFRDTKPVSILPDAAAPKLAAKDLLVYDPQGSVLAYLQKRNIACTSLPDLNMLAADAKLLIVGKDALTEAESGSTRLAAYAAGGHSVLVLEQKFSLRYQALPAAMEPAVNEGRIAFGEDLEHPLLRGLQQKDFFTWGADEILYRNAYGKPTSGGKSLVQCHERLQNTALAEVPVGNGLLLVCQLVVGEKIGQNAVAQHLLSNMLAYGASYKQEYRQVAACVGDNPLLTRALDTAGLKYRAVSEPMQALSAPGVGIAIVSASPANLKTLAENRATVEKFTQGGGYLFLHGLTPDGLRDYNTLVGFDHMIRPFRRERVTFAMPRSPLAAGLSLGDIVMLSGERIFDFNADEYVASDIFSYVVDYDEVAPFAKLPSEYHYNIVNGMVSADGWKYIFSFDLNSDPKPQVVFQLPKEQEFTEIEWIGNAFYHLVTKIELDFDGREQVSFATAPNNEPQTFAIRPARRAKNLTLRLAEWDKVSKGANVVGIDNVRLKAARSPEFYRTVKPLLNNGGLMQYVKGGGGIVLCNLLFKETEVVPVNAVKKRAILSAMLRNLKAPFSGGKRVIAGANLRYQPVDLSRQATQYRDEKGWFGDKNFTFKDLPTGRQTFGGVTFNIYDFPTSPVPTTVMLAGQGVPNNLPQEVRGIPVNAKADALFFLHTARLDQRRNPQEVRDRKRYEMLRYIVTYTDGQTAEIPIYAETDIEDYRQKSPAALPGAALGWTRPYPGTEFSAAAWIKQWDNPRPDVPIKSVDMVYGADRRGVPVLLAVTAASAP